ncbi:MaoC family dehydratase N-terminal domain-containing protein [Pusillimonas sp. SM2304]|uniref:FAS1-like dehydratase domain-containing protein n=1 Tax=Pusillimonas sp. SM2304 TaxID=3073241 RepID=UPI002874C2C8|nr:MaoC family dehydratase N-terminal domain-containing protein [Pusillimonas sp. SM2304]MDS1139898.1 MaoC family dehydratase N-terminal domain-containing protein [Pusillimonas sp. SM2304]
MSEIDLSLVGTLSEPFEVDIEKSEIRKFAEAIGDANPLYRDEAYARSKGYASLLAPPTYPTCFRPPVEPVWLRSLDRRRIVAGQMSFEYFKPITAGMRLTCRLRFMGVEDKVGARGRMQLLNNQLQGHDEAGALVFVAGRSTVYRSLEQVEQRSLA